MEKLMKSSNCSPRFRNDFDSKSSADKSLNPKLEARMLAAACSMSVELRASEGQLDFSALFTVAFAD